MYNFGVPPLNFQLASADRVIPGVFAPEYDKEHKLVALTDCQVVFGRTVYEFGRKTVSVSKSTSAIYAVITHPTYSSDPKSLKPTLELKTSQPTGSDDNKTTFRIYALRDGDIIRSYLNTPVIPVYT